MLKIFKAEKVILALTALILIAAAAFFLVGNERAEYSAKEHTRWTQPINAEGHTPQDVQQAININTADEELLQTLYGIGPVLAQRIVADRESNGPFQIPEDIIRVKGIGQGKLEQILNYITVG